MDFQCKEKKCENKAEFFCNCETGMTICADCMEIHCNQGIHILSSIYIAINYPSSEKIVKYISNFIEKINEAIATSTKLAYDLLHELKTNYNKTLQALNAEKSYYQSFLSKIRDKKLLKSEYSMFWNALNDAGVKNAFKFFEFSDEIRINPSFNCLKSCIQEFNNGIFNENPSAYSQKYLENHSFRESVQFLSELSIYQVRTASINSQKIIEKVKLQGLNSALAYRRGNTMLENELTSDSFTHSAENLQSAGIKLNYSELSEFFTEEMVASVIQIRKSLRFIERENGNEEDLEIKNFSDLIVRVDVAGCLVNSEILEIFYKKFDLNEHFRVVKQFFLLGQGDTFNTLFKDIGKNIEENDVNCIFHEAMSKTCFASFSPQLLKCLTLERDEKGSLFNLTYYIKSPLRAIFTNSITSELQLIFSFLFKLKSAEYQHKSKKTDKKLKKQYLNYSNLGFIHKYYILKFKITSLLNSIIYFITNEVIENEWAQFHSSTLSALCIEDIIFSFYSTIHTIKSLIHQSAFSSAITSFLSLLAKFSDLSSPSNKNLTSLTSDLNSLSISLKYSLSTLNAPNFLYLRLQEFQ